MSMEDHARHGDELWLKMIQRSSEKQITTPDSVVLIAGNSNVGKNQLLKSLSASSDIVAPKSYSGLQYVPLEVYSNENDVISHMNMYVLDGDDSFRYLLRYVINQPSLEKMNFVVLLVVDLSKPWECLESITKWVDIINEQIQDTFLTKEAYDSLVSSYYSKYCNEYFKISAMDSKNLSTEYKQISKNNIGIPLIVVGNKVDLMDQSLNCSELNSDLADFFLVHLRILCLNYGFGLIFTDLTNPNNSLNNVGLLYDYMLKLLYNFYLEESANILTKRSTFIPIGWDSQNKINIYKENISGINPDDEFFIHIRKPFVPTNVGKFNENIGYMDENEFYNKFREALSKDATDQLETSLNTSASSSKLHRDSLNPPDSTTLNQRSTPINLKLPNKPREYQPGELSNLFNSLLNESNRSKTHKK